MMAVPPASPLDQFRTRATREAERLRRLDAGATPRAPTHQASRACAVLLEAECRAVRDLPDAAQWAGRVDTDVACRLVLGDTGDGPAPSRAVPALLAGYGAWLAAHMAETLGPTEDACRAAAEAAPLPPAVPRVEELSVPEALARRVPAHDLEAMHDAFRVRARRAGERLRNRATTLLAWSPDDDLAPHARAIADDIARTRVALLADALDELRELLAEHPPRAG